MTPREKPSLTPLPADGAYEESCGVVEELESCPRLLSGLERWNVFFCVFAWACTACNVTLVVGTGAVVMLSIGGTDSSTSLPLGAYFFGASIVSLTVTPWIFERWGRKIGFLVGITFGLIGTALGAASIVARSPPLLLVASVWFGMATGVGFFLRFAAVELVPTHFSSKAVTLVVSGGCVAAFAGPESAQATKDLFLNSQGQFEYLGVFFMTGVFNVANILCISLIHFRSSERSAGDDGAESEPLQRNRSEFVAMLRTRAFIVPVLFASTCWAAMSLPMSILRVTMGELGYSNRESLTVLELHFLSMYAPGFFSGALISKYGPSWACRLAVAVFAMAVLFMLVSESAETGSLATWILGMMLAGIAWNIGFSGATVWLLGVYRSSLRYKGWVQAANDTGMFAMSGVWIFSTSYISEAGGGGLDGWKTVNFVVVGFVGFASILLSSSILFQSRHLEYQHGDTKSDKQ